MSILDIYYRQNFLYRYIALWFDHNLNRVHRAYHIHMEYNPDNDSIREHIDYIVDHQNLLYSDIDHVDHKLKCRKNNDDLFFYFQTTVHTIMNNAIWITCTRFTSWMIKEARCTLFACLSRKIGFTQTCTTLFVTYFNC